MVKTCLVIFFSALLMLVDSLLAVEVTHDYFPNRPVTGQKLVINFNIYSHNNDDAVFIEFERGSFEVLDRTKKSIVSANVGLDNKINSLVNTTFSYSVVPIKTGELKIKKIFLYVGSKKITYKNINIKVVGSVKSNDFFLAAEVSKNSVYVGEGIDLRYYLYSRYQIINTEIKKFPKLKGFIKRFYNVQSKATDTVYGGRPYKKKLVYSARVFPEKIGDLLIDSLSLEILYFDKATRGYTKRTKKKILRNNPSDIFVKPMPAKLNLSSFSGLIGEHFVTLTIDKHTFSVNDPISLKVIVEGPGALEKMSPVSLYDSSDLEEFETKVDLVKINQTTARKTFEYTYIGRSATTLIGSKKEVLYLDPKTSALETIIFKLPKIDILPRTATGKNIKLQVDLQNKTVGIQNKKIKLMAPVFATHSIVYQLFYFLNILLTILITFVLFIIIMPKRVTHPLVVQIKSISERAKENEISYSLLFELLEILGQVNNKSFSFKDYSMVDVIDKSLLSKNGKKYFQALIDKVEKKSFANKDNNIKFRKKYFKEITTLVAKSLKQ